MTDLPYVDADAISAALPWAGAVAALERALLDGLDPESGHPRSIVNVTSGQLLAMPGETPDAVGVKVLGLTPANPARGLPRVNGLVVLFDRETLLPTALLDGIAITTLRTASVSALAVDHLAVRDARRLVVFGTGPQGHGHVEAIRAVRPIESVTVVGRDGARAQAFAEEVRASGLAAEVGTPEAVATADVVACATTARTPIFDGGLLPGHACVVAVGSHEPDVRELDDTVFARADRVVVESRTSALAECGDVIMAIEAGALTVDSLIDLGAAVRQDPSGGIGVFKSSGMGWEDIVIAHAALAKADLAGRPHDDTGRAVS